MNTIEPNIGETCQLIMSQANKSHSDVALFQSFCSEHALTQLAIYRDFYPAVRKMVCKNSGKEEDARDVFHEALIVLCQYCEKKDFVLTTSLKTFVYSIARKRWLKQLEKNKRKAITFFDSWEFVDVDAILKEQEQAAEKKAEQIRIVAKYLGKLEHKAEQIIYLYYFEEKTMDEIAKILGYSNADSAKVQKYRAIVQLRKLMEADGVECSDLF